MGIIFEQDKILDENNVEHILFTEYFYQGEKYYVTRDNMIFTKHGETYKEISEELSKEIFNEMNTMSSSDVVEFEDYEGE